MLCIDRYLTCIGLAVARVRFEFLQCETRQLKILGDLHRIAGSPQENQIFRCPSVCSIGVGNV